MNILMMMLGLGAVLAQGAASMPADGSLIDRALMQAISNSPIALAILVFGALAKRVLFPWAELRWSEYREDKAKDRAQFERRINVTADGAKAVDRLAEAMERMGTNGVNVRTDKLQKPATKS